MVWPWPLEYSTPPPPSSPSPLGQGASVLPTQKWQTLLIKDRFKSYIHFMWEIRKRGGLFFTSVSIEERPWGISKLRPASYRGSGKIWMPLVKRNCGRGFSAVRGLWEVMWVDTYWSFPGIENSEFICLGLPDKQSFCLKSAWCHLFYNV